MTKSKPKYIEEDEYDELQEGWSDNYDIVRSQIIVHGKENEDALDTNFPLADFQAQQNIIQFIREQHLTAKKCKNYLKDPELGNALFDLIMTEMRDLAILHRNKKSNPIVRWTLKRETPEGAEKEADNKKEGTMKKIQRLIGREKKTNEEDEEND